MHLYFLHVFATEGWDHRFRADAQAQLLIHSRIWFSTAAIECGFTLP